MEYNTHQTGNQNVLRMKNWRMIECTGVDRMGSFSQAVELPDGIEDLVW